MIKNQYNYQAAKELIEKEYEKQLYALRKHMQNVGLDENFINKQEEEYINKLIDMLYSEVNGELEYRK